MSYTLFSGCSLTAGSGLELGKQDPALWVNQLHQRLFSHTNLINVSLGGRSNAGIFQDTVSALLTYSVEYAIVQWTGFPRYEIEVGFELYTTSQCFNAGPVTGHGHKLNNISYSTQYLNDIKDRFIALSHDQYEIVQILKYSNSIQQLARLTNTKLAFVNGMCPWDQEFFVKLEKPTLPDQLTNYTQKLLNAVNRDDNEILKLYDKMHQQYQAVGNVNQTAWLNLYESMRQLQFDVNSDGRHPGPKSNSLYAKQFAQALIENF
jgi:hypothetical protein